MELYNLKPPAGSTHKRKRVGRGPGSGHGKTATRGSKGQRSRSGYSAKRGFEGGQMPLHRRIPKRGFKNLFRRVYACVNVGQLGRFAAGSEITPELLVESGMVKDLAGGLKILAQGELDRPLTVKAHRFSQAAARKIAAAGGTIEEIGT